MPKAAYDNVRVAIKKVYWRQSGEQLTALRQQVFVVEQGVPLDIEIDGYDESSLHWLALVNGDPVGTARLLSSGQLGRMAVLAEWRGKGIGRLLLNAVVNWAQATAECDVFLHAQEHAIGFYAGSGFVEVGDRFEEAGIVHQCMKLDGSVLSSHS